MNMTKHKEQKNYRRALLVLVLLAGNLLFFLTIWMASKYDKVTLDQFIYQMKSSAVGANRDLINTAAVRVGLFGVVATALELLLYRLCTGNVKQTIRRHRTYIRFRTTRFARFVSRRAMALVRKIEFALYLGCIRNHFKEVIEILVSDLVEHFQLLFLGVRNKSAQFSSSL